ncbi:hypothetical protein XO10_00495 [Marinitoga sp. 1135]|uniref:hypothetical protein n=1 Tax=Marinitoga sp. 1135 TaxID=1643333 RepID=UPI001585EB52|nr:hypothetical protein [Marinitoga sp. 1135]NUU94800.1 hypothetical protein [Marinitoga sp. 1135]
MGFKLPEIIAATEKLDLAYQVVMSHNSESGVKNSLVSLFQLLKEDRVLKHITNLISQNINVDIDNWIEENAKLRGSMVGSGTFDLGKNKSERFLTSKLILEKLIDDEDFPLRIGHNWYSDNYLQNFLIDFLNTFYRELKFMLIDLRVKAELNESKNISEQSIINIVLSGNIQNVQAKNIDKSEFTQNE